MPTMERSEDRSQELLETELSRRGLLWLLPAGIAPLALEAPASAQTIAGGVISNTARKVIRILNAKVDGLCRQAQKRIRAAAKEKRGALIFISRVKGVVKWLGKQIGKQLLSFGSVVALSGLSPEQRALVICEVLKHIAECGCLLTKIAVGQSAKHAIGGQKIKLGINLKTPNDIPSTGDPNHPANGHV